MVNGLSSLFSFASRTVPKFDELYRQLLMNELFYNYLFYLIQTIYVMRNLILG